MKLKELTIFILSMVVLYTLLNLLGIGCPFKHYLGVSCAGCGMTRAYVQLLHFNFSMAYYYHPLFWLPPVFLIFYFCRNLLHPRVWKLVVVISILLFITVYIARLINPNDTVIVIDLKKGVLYYISKILKNKLGG